MLILNLIDGQYLQKALLSFQKRSDCENHALSGSHHLVKRFPQQNVRSPPAAPLNAIWKILFPGLI